MPRPPFQRLAGNLLLLPQYRIFPGVDVRFEGYEEHVPKDQRVIFAMNHTDRYNYFPFQFRLWKQHQRYTATWVKGKYYENPLVSGFMELTAQIPVPSRGYLIARDFLSATGRKPSPEEYEAIRLMLERQTRGEPVSLDELTHELPEALLRQPRSMLGRPFDPTREDYFEAIRDTFAQMMGHFVRLNEQALAKDLEIIIFPQGTRSIRLSAGHIGLAQIALHLDLPIVPVGCNGCDLVYPGDAPIVRGGTVTYRFGEPLLPSDYARWRPTEPFAPFTPAAEHRWRPQFQGLVDEVMQRINGLLDERYQFAEDHSSDGVRGTDRFL